MQKLNTFFHKVFPKKVAALFTSRKRETNFNRGITGFNPVKDKKQKKGLKFQKKKILLHVTPHIFQWFTLVLLTLGALVGGPVALI